MVLDLSQFKKGSAPQGNGNLGVAPAAAAPVADTSKPLNLADFTVKQPPLGAGGATPSESIVPPAVDYTKNLGGRLLDATKEAATNITAETKKAGEDLALGNGGAVDTLIKGPAIVGRTLMRAAGETTKLALDPIAMPLTDAIKAVSDRVSDLPVAQRIASSDAVSRILDKVNGGMTKLGDVAKNHPELAKDVDALSNILMTVAGEPIGRAATDAAIPAIKSTVRAGADISTEAAKSMKGIVKDTATGIVSKAGAATDALKAPFVSSYKPEVKAAFDRLGIEAPASAITDSKAIQAAEATAQGGIFGGDITKTIDRAREGIYNAAESVRKEVDPERLLTPGASAESAGKALQDAVETMTEKFNKAKSELYDSAAAKLGKEQADLTETRATLEKIIAEKTASLEPGARGAAKYYQTILNATRRAEKRDFNTIKQTRTDVGRKLRDRTDPLTTGDRANLSRLYAALSADLDKTVSVHPEGAAALKAANSYYKAGVQSLNSAVGRTIYNAKSPELLIGKLFRPREVTTARQVRALVGDEAFGHAAGAFMNHVVREAIVPIRGELSPAKLISTMERYGEETLTEIVGKRGVAELKELRKRLVANDIIDRATKDGKVMPAALARQIDKYDKVLEEIFGKEDAQKLRDVRTAATGLAKGTRMADGSPTAEKVMAYMRGGETTFALTSFLFGPIALAPIVTQVATEWGLAKALKSDLFKRYLTEGVKKGKTEGIKPVDEAKAPVAPMVPGTVKKEAKKGGLSVTRYSEKEVPGGVSREPKSEPILYHSSNEDLPGGKPNFDAYFGDAEWKKAFKNEFGDKEYHVRLSSDKKIIDLEDGSKKSRDFMAAVANKAFPKDKQFQKELLAGDGKAIQDFYEIWTDKNAVMPIIRKMGMDGAKFKGEYLITKEAIADLKTEKGGKMKEKKGRKTM